MHNVDSAELKKFAGFAHYWWDENGQMKVLHQINPLRLKWLDDSVGGLENKKVLDVGCGGGLLSEGMAQKGAVVTGIDLSKDLLDVAELHLLESGLKVQYFQKSAEDLLKESPSSFDVVTCFEMLEHVPHPLKIVEACAQLAKPGGFVAFATLNRTLKAYLFAILGAEYLLKLLPRGTHAIDKFIQPAELARFAENAGLNLECTQGISYHPLEKRFFLSKDLSINYFLLAKRPLPR